MATLKEFEDALRAAGNTAALDILETLRERDRADRSIRPARRLIGRKMTPELAAEVLHLHRTTEMTQQEIAFTLGVNQGRVNEVVKRGKWLDGSPEAPEAVARDKAVKRARKGVGISARQPAENTSPVEEALPVESALSAEEALPMESALPVEEALPVESALSAEEALPMESALPVEEALPVESALSAEEALPVESALPVEEAPPADDASLLKMSSPARKESPELVEEGKVEKEKGKPARAKKASNQLLFDGI